LKKYCVSENESPIGSEEGDKRGQKDGQAGQQV